VKRGDARAVYLSSGLVALSGVVYGYLLYFGEFEDEFGPVSHPWSPALQTSHVVVAPLFVFALGMIWNYHIVQKLASGARPRRRTGILLLSQTLPMIASGYLLQVSVDPWWRDVWIWSHVVTSLLFCVALIGHLLARAKPRRPLTNAVERPR